MTASILTSVKKALNIEEDDETFDVDILMHLNTVLATLTQIGLGTDTGFEVEDKAVTWDALLHDDLELNFVKTYIYTKIRLIFDPPSTSFAIEAVKEVAKELETRIYILLESRKQALIPPVEVPSWTW